MSKQAAVRRLMAELNAQQVPLHSLLMTQHGHMLAEAYFQPGDLRTPHRMYSVSKSVVALAVGILVTQGMVNLDATGASLFPEWIDSTTPEEARATTLRDMLRMTTCHTHRAHRETDANWAIQYYQTPAAHWPGGPFGYDSTGTQVLTALCRKLTGLTMLELLQPVLFDRIGATDKKFWLTDQSGVETGGTGLHITTRDLSRIANFCMSDGMGIISPEYLREATGVQVATPGKNGDQQYGYGYQFWMLREGFAMLGKDGQMALMLPRKGLTLCTTADTSSLPGSDQMIIDAFFRAADAIE